MKQLTSNGYQYYKNQDCWDPIEAASIICGIDPLSFDYNQIPHKIGNVAKQSVLDYKKGKMDFYIEKEITDKHEMKKFLGRCPSFCRKDDVYNSIHLVCFNPPAYVNWVIESKLVKVDGTLRIDADTTAGHGYLWCQSIDWNPEEPNSVESRGSSFKRDYIESYEDTAHHDFFDELNDNSEPDPNYVIYKGMKKLELWTLDEGVILLTHIEYVHTDNIKWDYEKYILNDLEFQLLPLVRAVKSGKLKVNDFNKEKNKSWKDSIGHYEISPFEFLDFIKEKDLFYIPSDLEYIKTPSKSGEIKYHWASENISDQAEQGTLGQRAETTYLNIIAALLECITGDYKDQEFSSETKLREFIHKMYDGYPGLRARTLAEKFADAKKELKNRY